MGAERCRNYLHKIQTRWSKKFKLLISFIFLAYFVLVSSLPATFDIEWTVNSIRVLRDGVLQIQSSVFIPNEPLHFEIVTYKNSGSVATMSIDEVLFRPAADLVTNDVPEPSSDLLFGIGLVALWFGRKGRTPQAGGQLRN